MNRLREYLLQPESIAILDGTQSRRIVKRSMKEITAILQNASGKGRLKENSKSLVKLLYFQFSIFAYAFQHVLFIDYSSN